MTLHSEPRTRYQPPRADHSDEVSFSDYQAACFELEHCAAALSECKPDEAAEHWLPRMTQQIALIFSFVGSNATMRHAPRYVRTVVEMEAAKDGTLPPESNTGGT